MDLRAAAPIYENLVVIVINRYKIAFTVIL